VAPENAVLLMAYGTPDRLEDVADYFTHIRGGRRPTPEAVDNLTQRYVAIGGATPLRTITETVRDRLRAELAADGLGHDVYIGMRHWHPYIGETMKAMREAGVRRVTAIALAPHYSRMSIGAYRDAVEAAHAELGNPFEVTYIDRWHDEPAFVSLIAARVQDAIARLPEAEGASAKVVFSAHSLPVRIREWADPYEAELRSSSSAVAERVGLHDWRFAWQSAGGSREPWIGPDILEYLETLAAEGVRTVVQVPIGFVSDHLEILYDVDIEATVAARQLGIHLVRTEMPNASPEFIRVLADAVERVEPASAK
jgi:protoporphyrin/coproporphyrin ferrochelatase